MKQMNEYELLLAKMIVMMQTQLELMDEFKGTPLYKREVKFHINNLERELEKYLKVPLSALDDEEKEKSFMALQRGVRNMLDASLESIYMESGETE